MSDRITVQAHMFDNIEKLTRARNAADWLQPIPGIEPQDKGPVDERFQMLAAVDFPKQERTIAKLDD